jgi:hypothetical protein
MPRDDKRLAAPEPADTWKAATRSYFLYRLKPDADGVEAHALFVTQWEEDAPLSAVIVIPHPDGGKPRIINLREKAGLDWVSKE